MPIRELNIENAAALEELSGALATGGSIGVDTEFIREKTYYPRLCLLQIATRNLIACVDCLADIDLREFLAQLLSKNIEWILHSSRQDLEIVFHYASRLPQRLVDTQIAAGLVGYPPQIGLQDLLADALGVDLPKDYTRTDWSRRPLPAAALDYARDDVRSLIALEDYLRGRLDKLGRCTWLEQDCALLTAQPPVPSAEQLWLRLRGLRALDLDSAATALALVEWREERAQRRDRPRRWILADEHIVAIAKRRPRRRQELSAIAGLPTGSVTRSGDELLAAVASASSARYLEPARKLADKEQPEKRKLRLLQDEAKKLASALGIHVETLATRQELADLLLANPPARIASTWRAELLAELAGKL